LRGHLIDDNKPPARKVESEASEMIHDDERSAGSPLLRKVLQRRAQASERERPAAVAREEPAEPVNLETETLSAEQQAEIENLQQESQRLRTLINNALDTVSALRARESALPTQMVTDRESDPLGTVEALLQDTAALALEHLRALDQLRPSEQAGITDEMSRAGDAPARNPVPLAEEAPVPVEPHGERRHHLSDEEKVLATARAAIKASLHSQEPDRTETSLPGIVPPTTREQSDRQAIEAWNARLEQEQALEPVGAPGAREEAPPPSASRGSRLVWLAIAAVALVVLLFAFASGMLPPL
jgi:hypothetical protein